MESYQEGKPGGKGRKRKGGPESVALVPEAPPESPQAEVRAQRRTSSCTLHAASVVSRLCTSAPL